MNDLFYRTHRSYQFVTTYRPTNWATITVPGKSLTIRDILARFSRGQVIPPIASPASYSDVDVSQFDNMDPFDRITAARRYRERATALEQTLIDQKASAAKKRADLAFDRAVNAKAQTLVNPVSDVKS